MLKLARRTRGHFVTLIEIRVHLIRCKPGHISRSYNVINLSPQINTSLKLVFPSSCHDMPSKLKPFTKFINTSGGKDKRTIF